MNPHQPSSSPLPGPSREQSDFRAFFLSLAGFIPFTTVLYVVLVCAIGSLPGLAPKNPDSKTALLLRELPRNLDYQVGLSGHMYTRANEARQTRDVDILLIGSSHSYRGFDPRVFAQAGFKTFNLGSSQQTHIQTRVLLKRCLDRLNPKVVFYEVYPRVFSIDGVESALDIIPNDRNDLGSVQMALQLNHAKVYHALIYGLFRQGLGLDSNFKEPVRRGVDTYVPGGYVERKMAYFKKPKKPLRPVRWSPVRRQLNAFEANLEMLRKRGIRVVLIQTPWTKCLYSTYKNEARFDEQMRSYGEYYNFNHLIELDDRLHFYDKGHMNQTGVEIFNRELIQRLFPERTFEANPSAPAVHPADSR